MSLIETKEAAVVVLGPYNGVSNDDQHALITVSTGATNATDDMARFQGAFVTVDCDVEIYVGIDANVGSSGQTRGLRIPANTPTRFYIPEGKHAWRVRGAGAGSMHVHRTSL